MIFKLILLIAFLNLVGNFLKRYNQEKKRRRKIQEGWEAQERKGAAQTETVEGETPEELPPDESPSILEDPQEALEKFFERLKRSGSIPQTPQAPPPAAAPPAPVQRASRKKPAAAIPGEEGGHAVLPKPQPPPPVRPQPSLRRLAGGRSMREAMVIAEILGPPKSLQR